MSFRWCWKLFLSASELVTKTVLEVFGISLSIAISLFEILSLRELLPFSGVTTIEPSMRSRSFHCSWQASPHLMPVSLSSCRKVAMRLLHPPISWSASFSVGMKGSFLILL